MKNSKLSQEPIDRQNVLRKMPSTGLPRFYGIYRQVSRAGGVSWRVCLSRRGRSFSRTFSVKRYGSDEAAIGAALAYRNKLVSEHAMVSRRENHVILRANCHSGIPGVRLSKTSASERWIASIRLSEGGSTSASFCVKKYGFDQAFELAVQARKQMLALVVDQKTFRAPCDPVLELAPQCVVTDVVVPLTSGSVTAVSRPSIDVQGVFRFIYRRRRPDGTWLESPMWGAEYRWPDKVITRRTYSVTRFGEDVSRQMAVDQRAVWDQHPPDKPLKGATRKGRRASRKPICSTHRKIQRSRSDGRSLAYWQVVYRFPDDGHQRSATFSVARYGEDGARALADAQCQQWLRKPPAKRVAQTVAAVADRLPRATWSPSVKP